ncbi:hypothetical protein [uncultured Cohaesibacter sp.]|uniref:hypothetical protein n=1 Tax=uncultured Cohaesibacter sp. TaxID=1002546 RepID=UPI0029C75B3D|nr:hypothetical protein [uncultured Cohaesibacter sp.]
MKVNFLAATIAGLTLAATSYAFAADRNVTIKNQTGYAIVEFYGSNSGTNEWEENILAGQRLNHGEAVEINFDDGTGNCMFDFLAVFEDDDRVTQENVDVCKIGTFTFGE